MLFRPFVIFLTTFGVAASLAPAQTTPTHKAAAKKTSTQKAAPKKAPAKPAATVAKKPGTAAARPSTATKKKTATKRVVGPPRQSAPTNDRYKEIQGALAAKGYLKSEPSGVWDAQSVDAMKRYQADEKQQPTGKLTAASLIGLGLGPKTALQSTADVKPADVTGPSAVESTAISHP